MMNIETKTMYILPQIKSQPNHAAINHRINVSMQTQNVLIFIYMVFLSYGVKIKIFNSVGSWNCSVVLDTINGHSVHV